MKRPLPLLILSALLLILLGGCTRHYYYGVPADDWHRMSEQERREIIRIYQERRMHEERRRAAEAEMRAREMEQQHPYYPELIYVHLSGGVFIYQGRRYAYHAHDLRLRPGEVRVIELVSVDAGRSHRVKLWVRYHEGKVMLGDGRRYLRSFDYRDSWKGEERYKGIKLRGDLLLDGASMSIGSRPYRGNTAPRFDRPQDSDRAERRPRLQEESTTPPLRPQSVPAPGNNGLPEKALSKQQQIRQEQEIREEQREEMRREKASRREAQKELLREKRESRQEMVREKQEALRQKHEAKQAEQQEQRNNSKPAAQGRLKEEALKEQATKRKESKKAERKKGGKGKEKEKEEKGQEGSSECVAPGEKRTGKNQNLPECGG